MDAGMVSQVRGFNRTVTQRVGALNDAFLNRGRPLGQARLLWEIGKDGADIRSLRSRLDLDSGYVSRLLRSLETSGLIVVEPSGTDARVRAARLTPAGQAEREMLDRLSDEAAASILEPLNPHQRTRLVEAMAEVERLLTASAVEITIREPDHPDSRHCLRAYFCELAERFDGGFDAAKGVPPTENDDMTPPAGAFLVATLHNEPVGCGGIKLHGDVPGYVKRMWVSPAVRGLGLGRRLLTELEQQAAKRGLTKVRLETNRVLTEAIAMYQAAGYREVPPFNDEPYAHHWFVKEIGR